MSYEKQTWKSGETITAEKLNHIEDGIAECCSDKGYECIEIPDEVLFSEVVRGY